MFSEFRPHCCLELRRPFSPSNTITPDRSSESLRAVSVSDTNSWKPGIRMQATGQSMHDGNSTDARGVGTKIIGKTQITLRRKPEDSYFKISFLALMDCLKTSRCTGEPSHRFKRR